MKFRLPLPFFALVLYAAVAASPASVSAADDGEDEKPKPPRNITIQFDWIKLSHADANRLVLEHLQRTRDGQDLYAAAVEQIEQKKAERLDFTSFSVLSGQQAASKSIIEQPHPSDYEIEEVPAAPAPAGQAPAASSSSSVPAPSPARAKASFDFRDTGRTVDVEAVVSEDNSAVDLLMTPGWVELTGSIPWLRHGEAMTLSAFGIARCTTQLHLTGGPWQLAALLTPPRESTGNTLPGSSLPEDRVLLFVRAAPWEEMTAPAEDLPGRQVTVLTEWIELDTSAAAGLLTAPGAFPETAALRESLAEMLTDGRASLLETSAMQVRDGQRAKVESIIEVPYISDYGPPQMAGSVIAGIGPDSAERAAGSSVEAEVVLNPADSPGKIDLRIFPELVFTNGIAVFGEGKTRTTLPAFQTANLSLQARVTPGAPFLLGTFDAPVHGTGKLPEVRARKVLVFVRAIPW